jgi:hypothetical protein
MTKPLTKDAEAYRKRKQVEAADRSPEERAKNAGKPGYTKFGVKRRSSGNQWAKGIDPVLRAEKRTQKRVEEQITEKKEERRKRNNANNYKYLASMTKLAKKARHGLPKGPGSIAKRDIMEAKDKEQRAKIATVGVMKSPEEIQALLVELECDPIARMAAIAQRAENAGELTVASNLYKELAQYAAPKRKAAEPKVVKDKNLLSMSEEELLAEIARLEASVG